MADVFYKGDLKTLGSMLGNSISGMLREEIRLYLAKHLHEVVTEAANNVVKMVEGQVKTITHNDKMFGAEKIIIELKITDGLGVRNPDE